MALTDSVSMEFSICSLCVTQKARRDPMFSEDRKKIPFWSSSIPKTRKPVELAVCGLLSFPYILSVGLFWFSRPYRPASEKKLSY